MVGLINLLPIPPFDGDKIFVSLFEKEKPPSDKSDDEEEEEKHQAKKSGPVLTIIWVVRVVAIFLFLGNIILSILNFNIFTLFSSIF